MTGIKTKKLTVRQQAALDALKGGPVYFKQTYGRQTKGPFRSSDKKKVPGDLKRQDFFGLSDKGYADHKKEDVPMIMTSMTLSSVNFKGVDKDVFSLKESEGG